MAWVVTLFPCICPGRRKVARHCNDVVGIAVVWARIYARTWQGKALSCWTHGFPTGFPVTKGLEYPLPYWREEMSGRNFRVATLAHRLRHRPAVRLHSLDVERDGFPHFQFDFLNKRPEWALAAGPGFVRSAEAL